MPLACDVQITPLNAVPDLASGTSVPLPDAGRDATSELCEGLFIVVLARNEARRLPACLHSARFAERTLVIDAGSSDETVAIARRLGAQVESYPDWRGFGVQRTRSLQHCQEARYIFFLDADEEITPALCAEICTIVRTGQSGAWTVNWEQVAFGRTLAGMASAPGMPRLFSADCLLGFGSAVHEQALLAPDTLVMHLGALLRHHSYDSVRTSLKKLSQYAMLGAAKRAARGQRGGVWRGLASASALFLRLYVLQRGFLHGGAGFLYCYVRTQECFFRYAALRYDRNRLTDTVERER
ncbi:MAG: glycosyltransferase family 2 protein [Burkholderiaceae bacterium]|nr:glycosyltransferase family 2 protein [Burkholderiaceae bacterium]